MDCMESLKLFILPTAMASMYPYMYPLKANLSGGLEFTGTLQSPSGTKLNKKALLSKAFFFVCRKARRVAAQRVREAISRFEAT